MDPTPYDFGVWPTTCFRTLVGVAIYPEVPKHRDDWGRIVSGPSRRSIHI